MTPVVLQHGLFGFSDIKVGKLKLSYFQGIDRAITDRGFPVIVSRVHPTSTIELCARQLRAQILKSLRDADNPKGRVVIFAHSMGGLDARYMISKLRMANHVAALVTLATPHRGSPYADWVLRNLGKRLGGMKLVKLLGLDLQAIHDLSTENCAEFNDKVEDSPDVRYFWVAGSRPWHRMAPIFLHSQKIIQPIEGENDGMVSIQSAKWGEHLGTWPCDHLHLVNRRIVPEIRSRTGDVCGRYIELLNRLADEGLVNSIATGAHKS